MRKENNLSKFYRLPTGQIKVQTAICSRHLTKDGHFFKAKINFKTRSISLINVMSNANVIVSTSICSISRKSNLLKLSNGKMIKFKLLITRNKLV